MKGRIQIYTGNGKGKTTAALGLSLRSVCAGGRVFFGQFLKGSPCSELSAPGFLPGFTIEQFGRGSFLSGEPCTEDVASARNGLERCRTILEEGAHDLVVLDEVNVALHYGLFGVDEVTAMLQGRADHVEVVLTGRYAPESLIAVADLVTEMREIKHYFASGVRARAGIDR